MNEASVYLLKQNNGTKEIFSNNFFLSTFESYHPLRENDQDSMQNYQIPLESHGSKSKPIKYREKNFTGVPVRLGYRTNDTNHQLLLFSLRYLSASK